VVIPEIDDGEPAPPTVAVPGDTTVAPATAAPPPPPPALLPLRPGPIPPPAVPCAGDVGGVFPAPPATGPPPFQ